ncbi:vanadium-dependent haloperoxidase [Flavihumibacter sp. RY-1]|uniref:Vanadium-dependent haloperoxidase n=1 Tax=Flavihumibacter fluminis TaxID=2909236 RepID=A0ABS9BIY8_9BACT|nr:vanadium-dependent haloperoxidase [Flavihumibacter fluminis]
MKTTMKLYKVLQYLAFLAVIGTWISCADTKSKAVTLPGVEILHANQKKLTDLIIYDVFTPPVAARIYSYTSLASYEAIRHLQSDQPSLTAKLPGFKAMPLPEQGKEYDFLLSATRAFLSVANSLTFSVDTLLQYEKVVLATYKSGLDPEVYERSIAFGETIAKKIMERAAIDNYPQTRGKPRYIGSRLPGKWKPTAPDYSDAVEPCWGDMLPFYNDSVAAYPLPPAPAYSMNQSDSFYKQVMEVYTIGNNLTEEQKLIATYWDDNPFVTEHEGHLMFANKKITPGGHWMGIASIACKKAGTDPVKTARVLALTAMSLMDGFIVCWDAKYKYELVRPITVINEQLDKNWLPYLQTPPFPEYPSGHSVITAAAATVLTIELGENFAFHDDSDKEYIGLERDFNSFQEAAAEASISRVYGGIHFRPAVEEGTKLGTWLGAELMKKINAAE